MINEMTNRLGFNIDFPIYNEDGTPFHDLSLRKSTFDSVIMSLGDKITGDVYYKDNNLTVTMREYIEYKRNEDSAAVKYILVSPPTIVREGLVADNNGLNGMTKYSFEFYHPMCLLSSFSFSDVAVTEDEERYLSQNKKFNWIGDARDYVAKLNANLKGTQWVVGLSDSLYDDQGNPTAKITTLSEVLTFDKNTIADALKTAYEKYDIPFVIDQIPSTDAAYSDGKRFLILFGLPSNEIYEKDENGDVVLDENDEPTKFVFRFGQGVGLKNNSRNPKKNKIITRLSGYGSSDNIPYGYPQIIWLGDQDAEYTIGDSIGIKENVTINGKFYEKAISYPIYDGIVGGRYVKLIKHPFTRDHLMPSVYSDRVNKKVNPYAEDYDPFIEIIDYYDATAQYPNPINLDSPSYETHEFEKIKPQLGAAFIVDAKPYDTEGEFYFTYATWYSYINGRVEELVTDGISGYEYDLIVYLRDVTCSAEPGSGAETPITEHHAEWDTGSCTASVDIKVKGKYVYATVVSAWYNVTYKILQVNADPAPEWDDTMNGDGEYIQSYFTITLPLLSFDLYASAAITQNMTINMRSGACIGCTFPIQVDWEDYKLSFYDADGNFAPDGAQRDLVKYPKSNVESITVIVQKEIETFGTLMPNIYQQPKSGDKFVILGISLPLSYITTAEEELDDAMKEYMLENNVHYYDYPLKFDEFFLANNPHILEQIRNNTIVRFQYSGVEMALYVKQMTVKFGDKALPQYDITLTDDVEIVLNQVGQVTDDVSRVRVQLSELQKYYSENIINAINSKLSKIEDDVCEGHITFQQGLDAIAEVIFHDKIQSPQFTSGLYDGRGWRIDQLGNGEMESLRVRSFLEVVELLVNRLQAQEGDTLFTDNDQIEKVEEKVYNGSTYYVLTLKAKWEGYISSQQTDNILKGIINTLAANYSDLSQVDDDTEGVVFDGSNSYYTSWMKVIDPTDVGEELGTNQIAVTLYPNDYTDPVTDITHHFTPAGINFPPCELMTIARWGCDADPSQASTEAERENIKRRQRIFSISTTDGRITKLRGVNKPILEEWNYGTTLGVVPDFIKRWSIASRLIEDRDYLYAQGIIVGDFIKVDINGAPLINYVDKGEWEDNTVYLHNEYNSTSLQWETNDVWHNGAYWRCLVHQPYNGVYYEPTEANVLYWEKLLASGDKGDKGEQGDRGNDGKDATEVNPNILLRTIFENKNVVKQAWEWSWNDNISIDNNNAIEGRKSIRLDGTFGLSSGDVIDFRQNVYGKVKTSTWYTLSFYSFSSQDFGTYLWNGDDSKPSCIDTSVGFYVDGVHTSITGNGYIHWNGAWDGARHTITFKTASSFSTQEINMLFRCFYGGILTICMPKLEIGQVATAYMANEDDLRGEKGDTGERGKTGRFFYYAQAWVDTTNVSYKITDSEAPYFSYGTEQDGTPKYWMWVGANHESGISMHDMGEPTNSNTNFALMVTDFKYLITEAIFSDTAKLGSSYICGDWQISTYGILYDANNQAYVIDATSSVTIDGVTYTKDNAYTKFDADFTDYSKDGAINFAPNYAVDLLTGNGSFMNVTIRNSLFFNKTVNSKFNSIPSVTMPTEEYYALTDGTYELMIEDDYSSFKMRGNIYMLGGIFNNDGSNKDKRFMINLPPAKLCHGMQITFFNNTTFDEVRTQYEIGVPLDFYVDFDEFGIEAIESSGLSVCYNGFYDPFNVAEIEKGLSSYKNESWWLPKNIRKLTFTAGVNPDAYKDGQGNSDAWRDENCIAWILTDYEYQQ